MDSGSTETISNQREHVKHITTLEVPVRVRVANNASVSLHESGTVALQCPHGSSNTSIELHGVLINEDMPVSLLSVSQLCESGGEVHFTNSHCTVTKGGRTVATIPKLGQLYVWPVHKPTQQPKKARKKKAASAAATAAADSAHAMAVEERKDEQAAPAAATPAIVVQHPALSSVVPVVSAAAGTTPTLSPLALLHSRLGHPSATSMKHLLTHSCLRGVPAAVTACGSRDRDLKSIIDCEGCEYGKSSRTAFHRSIDPSLRASACMDAWHSDLAGPIRVAGGGAEETIVDTLGGGRYACIVVDEYSHKVWCDILVSKDETAAYIIALHRRMTVQSGLPLKRLHSDGGGEYQARELVQYLHAKGTTMTQTTAHTPQHNGIAERMNRTIFEKARSMLATAALPTSFWAEAVRTAVYLSRYSCSRGSGDPLKSAEELWTGSKPSIAHLRRFGCDVFVHTQHADREGKLHRRASKGIFIGYEETKLSAYRCFVDGRLTVSRDCVFHEERFTAARALMHAILAEDGDLMPLQHHDDRDHASAAESDDVTDSHSPTNALPAAAGRGSRRPATHRLYLPWSGAEREYQQQIRLAEILSKKEEQLAVRNRLHRQAAAAESDADAAQEEHKQAEPQPLSAAEAEAEAPAAAAAPSKAKKKSRAASAAAAMPAPAGARRSSRHTGAAAVDYRDQVLAAVPLSDSDSATATATATASLIHEPSSLAEALASPQRAEWLAAVKSELKSIHAAHTWTRVNAAEVARLGRRPIGSKLVFKVKRKSDGSVERFKARLVAKGFSQQQGLDYHEVFAPVMKYKSLRVLLTLVAVDDLELQQLDVETAFLNGRMEEEVFMKLPPGVEHIEQQMQLQLQENHDHAGSAASNRSAAAASSSASASASTVVRLNRTLYGTKQASRQWYLAINSTLLSLGFVPCVSDPCVYTRCDATTGSCMHLGLFVDDMLVAYRRADSAVWLRVKAALCSAYSMKDLGSAEWILGMKISRDRRRKTLQLDQQLYISSMLSRFGMDDSRAQESPEEVGAALTKADCPVTAAEQQAMAQRPYMELVGSLLYASISTRPDIAHAVCVCSRFMQNPGDKHWKQAKRILRYLQGTKQLALHFGDFQHLHQHEDRQAQQHSSSNGSSATSPSRTAGCPVSVYCDADWAGDVDDRRSTTGCVLLLHGCPIVWLSKKQATVALSTAEAEYMAMSAAVQEVKWLTALLSELREPAALPVTLYTDNQAAVSISSNAAVPHTRTKHIDLRHHYVRECVLDGSIRVSWIRSEQQLADVFTKGLNKLQHKQLTDSITNASHHEHKQSAPPAATAAAAAAPPPLHSAYAN